MISRSGSAASWASSRPGVVVALPVDVDLRQLEPVIETAGIERHGALHVGDRLLPRRLAEDAGAQQVLREEAAQPREPHDLGVPAAEDVVGPVVARVEREGAQGLVADDAGAADPLLLPHGERRAPDGGGQGEVPVRAGGVGRHGPARQDARRGRRANRARGSSCCRGSARPRRAGRWRRASSPRSPSSRAPAPPRSGRARCGGRAPAWPPRRGRHGRATDCAGERQGRRARAAAWRARSEVSTEDGPGDRWRRMVIPQLIEHKRDGRALSPEQWAAADPGVRGGPGAGLPDVGAAHGRLLSRARAGGAGGAHRRDDRLGRPAPLRRLRRPRGRQALDRRRRRQGVAASRADGGELRRRGADDVGPRARPHRRHARQARVDPRVPHRSLAAGGARPGRPAGLRHAGADAGDRARRQAALRAPGRHRHGGVDPAHRRQHHVEEAGRGTQRPRARREDRERRVPHGSRARHRARAHDDRPGRGPRLPHRRAAHGDGPPARPRLRQRARGRGGDRGTSRRRPGRPDGGHLRARRRDAGAGARGAGHGGGARAGWRHR